MLQPHNAARNRLLRALPPDVFARLLPKLTPIYLTLRQILYQADSPINAVYFVEDGMISMVSNLEEGTQAEVGIIGPEGMLGMPLVHGIDTTFVEAMVQIPGKALQIGAREFRAEIETNAPLRALLLRFSEVLQAQIIQTAACNGRHGLEQRLARWLLMAHDRVASDTLPLTQEFMAMMLGVHRPSITVTAGILQRAGLIRYAAGQITILDRASLQASSCECYAAVRRRAAIDNNRRMALASPQCDCNLPDCGDFTRSANQGAASTPSSATVPGEQNRLAALEAENASLRARLARERLVIDSATDYAIITLDPAGALTSLNEGARRLLGYRECDVLGRSGEIVFTPEDRARGCFTGELRRAEEEGRAPNERWHVRADGTRFWASGMMMAVREADGALSGYVNILRDRTETLIETDRRELIMAEMNHRLKNAFATVQAIALQTGREAATTAAFHAAFSARLQALALSHDVLIRSDWRDAPLDEVISRALHAYGPERVALHGPPVLLGASLVVTVSLALHELATNAVKYGALSNATGHVDVRWSIEGAGTRIEILWCERGGPPVTPPTRRGFGSRLLEQGMPSGGKVALCFHPQGVECSLCLPLRPGV